MRIQLFQLKKTKKFIYIKDTLKNILLCKINKSIINDNF